MQLSYGRGGSMRESNVDEKVVHSMTDFVKRKRKWDLAGTFDRHFSEPGDSSDLIRRDSLEGQRLKSGSADAESQQQQHCKRWWSPRRRRTAAAAAARSERAMVARWWCDDDDEDDE
ncbi:hypothetical protein AXG93_4012s1430 [Marchantia polymorpha subsp. ruderalis]|uniref:Uncharacterized protein n=1 Tax=Marchantia polymorpha subsp. ruderalis TaxID=1480154 RepID=A0A176VLL7_MARPO|nr:hypothetical protein AXG93_4012s1430 [Marchantia polymorpha subsp. ruderalis]